jgi:ABC-type Fe3+-hydroxamate transport system substrate-binding protein
VRIVSLVPSLTELLIDLGLENDVVGRTKFCIHPADKVKSIPKIGGTKNVNISKVADLNPDLILANKEENTKEDVEALRGIAFVHLTEIANFSEAIQSIADIGELTHRVEESKKLICSINSSFTSLAEHSDKRKSVCYLIWKDPLMTIGHDTFIHDMLYKCGFINAFGDQGRYPTVTASDIKTNKPDFIFLSSEPFPFKDRHIEEFSALFPYSKVVLVDGEYFSWYGSRMVAAARYFEELIGRI